MSLATTLRDWRARGFLWPGVVLLAVIAVLAHGAFRRSAAPDPEPARAVAATSVPVVRPDLEAAPLSYLSDYWLQLGERARARIALVGSRGVPALVLAPGLALTSSAGVDGLGDAARVAAVDPDTELALLELPPETAPPPFQSANRTGLRPGALLAVVTLDHDGRLRIASGQLVSMPSEAGEIETTAALPRPAAAAALVDLDGRLVGGVFAASGRVRRFSLAALEALLSRLRDQPRCQALEFGDLDGAVRRLLGLERGALVEHVRRQAFAEPALRAGDVLLSWRGERVTDAAGARRLLAEDTPGTRVAHTVLRAGRRVRGVTVVPGPDCRPVPSPPRTYARLGLTLQRETHVAGGEPRVREVAAGGAAAQAGLLAGDLVLAIGAQPAGTPGAQASLDAFERAPRPMLLTVRRNDRVRLVAVAAVRE